MLFAGGAVRQKNRELLDKLLDSGSACHHLTGLLTVYRDVAKNTVFRCILFNMASSYLFEFFFFYFVFNLI